MRKRFILVGISVLAAVVLFTAGLFLIGNQHKAFTRHTSFYVDYSNVNEIAKGAKVRVSGMDAGQVQEINVPTSPAHKFRLKLDVDDRLRGLIRNDSVVTIETSGIVGDKFLLIHSGSEQSPEAPPGSTLNGEEPFDLSKMLKQANGLLDQAHGTITDVQGRLDAALDGVTKTVSDTDGVVKDIRSGKGTAGLLLENQQTADNVRQIVSNSRDATANLDKASAQVNGMLNEAQSRQLVAKLDDTITNAKGASQQFKDASVQIDQASQQVNSTLKSAFAEDQYGQTAGTNLQQSLSNVNVATGNLAEDTAALKHEFFFRGFFKKRGYDTLNPLPVEQYRNGDLFKKSNESRQWIPADALFTTDANGGEQLLPSGREEIDRAVSAIPDLYSSPLIIEGYSSTSAPGEELLHSRDRAILVRAYLQTRYHLPPQEIGIVGLSNTPPQSAGKSEWNGICFVHLSPKK